MHCQVLQAWKEIGWFHDAYWSNLHVMQFHSTYNLTLICWPISLPRSWFKFSFTPKSAHSVKATQPGISRMEWYAMIFSMHNDTVYVPCSVAAHKFWLPTDCLESELRWIDFKIDFLKGMRMRWLKIDMALYILSWSKGTPFTSEFI